MPHLRATSCRSAAARPDLSSAALHEPSPQCKHTKTKTQKHRPTRAGPRLQFRAVPTQPAVSSAYALQPPHAGIIGYAYACIYDAPAPSASPVACCKAVSTETSAAAAREAQTAMTRLAIAAASPGAEVGTSSHSSSTARRSTRTYADGSGCGAQNRAERGVQHVPLEHARAL